MKKKPPTQGELFPDEQVAAREKLYVDYQMSLAKILADNPATSPAMMHGAMMQAVDEAVDKLHERKER